MSDTLYDALSVSPLRLARALCAIQGECHGCPCDSLCWQGHNGYLALLARPLDAPRLTDPHASQLADELADIAARTPLEP